MTNSCVLVKRVKRNSYRRVLLGEWTAVCMGGCGWHRDFNWWRDAYLAADSHARRPRRWEKD